MSHEPAGPRSARIEPRPTPQSPSPVSARQQGDKPEPLAMHYCPNCSQRLEERGCKLRCERCGYFMDCSDYY